MLKLVLDKFFREDLDHLKSEGVATWNKTWGNLGHVFGGSFSQMLFYPASWSFRSKFVAFLFRLIF